MVRVPKLSDYVCSPLTVYAMNGYIYTGTLLSIDRHMNMVISSCCCRFADSTRHLGLIILRGEEVAFFTQDKDVMPVKPSASNNSRKERPAPSQKPTAANTTHKPVLTKPSFVIPGLGRAVKSKVKV